MTEPKFAWGGVDHDDVGKVAKIMNSSEHGKCLCPSSQLIGHVTAV